MDMIGKIRRMHRRDKTKRQISRGDGAIEEHGGGGSMKSRRPKYRREAVKTTKLSAYEAELTLSVEGRCQAAQKERRTAKALFAQIKAAGYEGGYTRVTDFIRKWRQGKGQGDATKAFVPLTFELGEAFQFDWSEDGLVIGGVYYRLQVRTCCCAASSVLAGGLLQPGHEMLFDAHRALRPGRRGRRRGLRQYEDGRGQGAGKGRVVNARFPPCARTTCSIRTLQRRPAGRRARGEGRAGQSQGIWLEAGQQRAQLAELNAGWASAAGPGGSCATRSTGIEHRRDARTRARAPHAHAAAFDGYVEHPVRVSSTCLVTWRATATRCPVNGPGRWSARTCTRRRSWWWPAIPWSPSTHERLSERNQWCYDWQHYVPLIERKPGRCATALRLPICPTPYNACGAPCCIRTAATRSWRRCWPSAQAGLDAVLVAVELALQSAPPSGRVSCEHVINVLARLQAQPRRDSCDHPAGEPGPWPTRHATTACARTLSCGRPIMRELDKELKELRLYGMAGPGRIWSSKAVMRHWRARAGCWSTCCRPRAADSAMRSISYQMARPSSLCTATWRALTSSARRWAES